MDDLGGMVHEGFLEELGAVQDRVVAELLKPKRGGRSRPVYVTGHSQGGAEAVLATRALLAGGFPVVATYTFAAPRPGNAEFTQSVPATLPVHRIEFGDDIVPHLPPKLIGKEIQKIVKGLKLLPFLDKQKSVKLLDLVLNTSASKGFTGLGTLCYGSYKTRGPRVDMSDEAEASLFYDRLWSLIRHPERWAEHHHLAGTSDEVKQRIKGNYTALVSQYQVIG